MMRMGAAVAEARKTISSTGARFGARLRALMESRYASDVTGPAGEKLQRPLSADTLFRLLDSENNPDVAMSRGHLYRLLDGQAVPRLDLIEALARFFKVPASYFVSDDYLAETIEAVDSALGRVDGMVAALDDIRTALVKEREIWQRQIPDTADPDEATA